MTIIILEKKKNLLEKNKNNKDESQNKEFVATGELFHDVSGVRAENIVKLTIEGEINRFGSQQVPSGCIQQLIGADLRLTGSRIQEQQKLWVTRNEPPMSRFISWSITAVTDSDLR